MTRKEQIKGKRLAISGLGSGAQRSADSFQKINLKPAKDVTPTGTGPERLAAMSSARLDASFLNPSEVRKLLKPVLAR
jgi:ABC-type nitrate/sulfonate/bicarbonate transport system substrate-binding protein